MRETLSKDRAPPAPAPRPEALEAFAAFAGRVSARSQIVWGEHCSECDYPACYSSCAFYTPRPDLHCRRFEAGIEPVAGRPELMRIRFRKWGKLEGKGPAPLRGLDEARRIERRNARAAAALRPLPYALERNLAWRWSERRDAMLSRRTGIEPEALVVEAAANDGRTHAFTVSILPASGHGAGLFQARFDVGASYARLVVPIAAIRPMVDLGEPWLIQIEPVGEAAGRDVTFGFCDFARFDGALLDSIGQTQPEAPKAKVVVWDLDETLWTGTLAEEGVGGVSPRPDAVAAVKALDERGVIQSIASKNDAEEAMAALERFGLKDYFLHPQIHWSPKSGSVAEIARRLDLGLDSFVFIDDQPFERGEVQAALPMVRALPHTAAVGLALHPWFDLPVTAESRKRRSLYQVEAARTEAMEAAPGGDYLAFLRASNLSLDLRPLAEPDFERVHELSQRTNQLNFTGARLGRDEVAAMAAAPDLLALTLRCADRFGDYGLIGFAALDLAEGRLAEFFMSCRVQKKRVEHAAFAHLAERLSARGHETFAVAFRPTERNKASVALLTDLGFVQDADGWRRPLADPFPDADVVRLAVSAPAPAEAA